ncbi:hypothetical protein LMG18091_03402 [Ralstonia wenshanensis]|uniref:Uncharacterized protein n=1 Tax=Ralstonia wenshanensis TaxID=2842456 RepID=A0AAD2ER45_9RALS|nr:hypothetical protein LMG18091_03402 [Ralstonia wenshanensis]
MAAPTDQLPSERPGLGASETGMLLRLAFYMKCRDRTLKFEQRFRHIRRRQFVSQRLPSSIAGVFGLRERPIQPRPAYIIVIR